VSRRDVLGVFLRSDEDIRDEIQLERRSEVETARRLVPDIPGVVEVRDQLGYEWNDVPERHHA
jgi:hypothetical protein